MWIEEEDEAAPVIVLSCRLGVRAIASVNRENEEMRRGLGAWRRYLTCQYKPNIYIGPNITFGLILTKKTNFEKK